MSCQEDQRQSENFIDCRTCPGRAPELFPDNVPAWTLWQYVRTQWRTGGMGGLIGLDYGAVFEVARTLDIEMHRGNLDRIRALENEAINKSREKPEGTK